MCFVGMCVCWAVAPQRKYTLEGGGGYIRKLVGKFLLIDRGGRIAHENGATTEDGRRM